MKKMHVVFGIVIYLFFPSIIDPTLSWFEFWTHLENVVDYLLPVRAWVILSPWAMHRAL